MSEDADLLIELCSVDEVEARIPTAMEQDSGVYPPWSEVILTIKRSATGAEDSWPVNITLPLRRHDAELLLVVLGDVMDRNGHRSSIEQMWGDLDEVVDRIQARIERGKDPLKRDVGQALGIATSLAYLGNPAEPDVDAVRAEAMDRYDARNV